MLDVSGFLMVKGRGQFQRFSPGSIQRPADTAMAASTTSSRVSVRRFWRADHSKRWHYTVLGFAVIAFLLGLVIVDVVELVG